MYTTAKSDKIILGRHWRRYPIQKSTYRRILLLPLPGWVPLEALQHGRHVLPADAGGLGLELAAHGPKELLADLPPTFGVAALHIAEDVVVRVVLELLLVGFPDHNVGDDDLGNDVAQGVGIVEQILVHELPDEGGEETNGGGGQSVVLGLVGKAHEEIPNQPGELGQEGEEGLLILVGVQVEILHDGGLQYVDGAGLVLLVGIGEDGVLVLQVAGEFLHPLVHVILEVFRQVLPVEGVEYPAHGPEGGEARFELGRVVRGGLDGLAGLDEEGEEGGLEALQNVQDVAVQVVGPLHVAEPAEDGVGRNEDARNDVGVGRVESLDEVGEEVVPVLREVDLGDEGYGLGALGLDLGGDRAHQVDEVILDEVAIGRADGNALRAVLGVLVPSLLADVLEVNGRGLPNGGIGGTVTGHNVKDDQRVAINLLRFGQTLLGLVQRETEA